LAVRAAITRLPFRRSVNTYRRARDCGSQLHVRAGTKPVTAGRPGRRRGVGFFAAFFAGFFAGAVFGVVLAFGCASCLDCGRLVDRALSCGLFATVVTGVFDGTVAL
jgi:hypothetical protein